MLDEFKAFAMKGDVVDLAVAVVIGGAFGKIVSSLASDIIMPAVGVLAGGINFTELRLTVGAAEIKYGIFIQSIIDFTIIAFALFFAIKILARLKKKEAVVPMSDTVAEIKEEVREEVLLLREIRDTLQK
ncbi:hypothetical protein A3C87_00620 [Candidatus Kaiserbacteria bacterium RIFCSPHIGHO2_02_FULL_49_34]|uniref:Large-conductance mechanosensitive channel n=1 Tax=Candidatus Kaiserbacteria bacterium RIFCSPHIGHO2_02_FULL_49_34 TaxID=1798491 RepID=A0A1F6DKT3_9BACT|nr:MAG: hypothetical protein A3C87_00620 [Candidatus Kaiserbacteria bacterium RIFCSPHIGHO2_02_FULL_49_34]